jgi:mono/diheme cytochrome c family protein
MKRALLTLFLVAPMVFFSVTVGRGAVPADSARGERLFQTLACIQCHSVNGRGGTTAPDLGRAVNRDFSPAAIAATMWNHAPTMWAAMRERGIRAGDLDEQAAADLFAYFYSSRFFERSGDAGRGKRQFAVKHCAECHGLTAAKIPEAKPVAEWEAAGQPIALVNAMWNHAATMRQEFARRRLSWPELTAQDLADMLVYLRNLPASRGVPARLEITAGARGEALFQSKGCSGCHAGKLALAPRLKGQTLTDIAVEMWNHAPRMAAVPPRLELEEMRELASYLWAEQFFMGWGNRAGGERVFRAKGCAGCHADAVSGAPPLPKPAGPFTGASMVSALWRHGPQMQDQMNARGVRWPRFDRNEMTDLIAYLNPASEGR